MPPRSSYDDPRVPSRDAELRHHLRRTPPASAGMSARSFASRIATGERYTAPGTWPSAYPYLPHVDDADVGVGSVGGDPVGVDELFGVNACARGQPGQQKHHCRKFSRNQPTFCL